MIERARLILRPVLFINVVTVRTRGRPRITASVIQPPAKVIGLRTLLKRSPKTLQNESQPDCCFLNDVICSLKLHPPKELASNYRSRRKPPPKLSATLIKESLKPFVKSLLLTFPALHLAMTVPSRADQPRRPFRHSFAS